jgi:nicotinamidase-related amidase
MTLTNGQRSASHKADRPPGRPALLIIDMINCFDFPGSEILEPNAAVAHRIGA